MQWLRSAAERLLRGVTFRRRLPPGFGPGRILVSPDAMLKVARWDLATADPILFAAARDLVKPGMTVWDIGANLGLFGFAAAWKAGPQGRVLLVEPDPWLCALLQRSARGLAKGGYAELSMAACAVVDAACPVRLNVAARGRASNAVGGYGYTQMGGTRESVVVGAVTLDQLAQVAGWPDLVKIDVEGAEIAVLRGASAVLARRPTLILEIGREIKEEATALLHAAGYRLFDAENGMRPVEACSWATVAVAG